MAVGFMLAYPYGKTRVMSSYAFEDPSQGPPADSNGNILSPLPAFPNGNETNSCGRGWVCEHRWPEIVGMVRFRNVVGDSAIKNWWSNGENQIAFAREGRGFIAFNNQQGSKLEQTLQTSLPAGTYCDVISGRKRSNMCTGKNITVEQDGTASIAVESIGFIAIHILVTTFLRK